MGTANKECQPCQVKSILCVHIFKNNEFHVDPNITISAKLDYIFTIYLYHLVTYIPHADLNRVFFKPFLLPLFVSVSMQFYL